MNGLALSLLLLTSDPVNVTPDGISPPYCTKADDAACKTACEGLVRAGEYVKAYGCKRKTVLFLPIAGDGVYPRIAADCGCDIRPIPTTGAKVEKHKVR